MKTLIVNADDLGYDPAVTRGMLKAMREGIVTSCTLMVNTPFSAEAASAARALPAGRGIGLHLNLARHPPLANGWAAQHLERGELAESLAGTLPVEAVRDETNAQLDRLEQLLGRPATHLDVHKHLHRFPAVLEGVAQAAKQRGLPVRAISAAMRTQLRAAGLKTPDHFIGDAQTLPYWTLAQLERSLATLEEGVTELMCHPGYAPSRVTSGYSVQREVELATFLSPRARELVETLGVELRTFEVAR